MSQDIQISGILTCLPEKFVVDFANSIDVVHDHLRVQRDRSDLFDRLYDEFSGKSHRRQGEVNSSLAYAVQGSLQWLTELTTAQAKSNFAIAKVNDRLNQLKLSTADIAHYSADTRQKLEDLSSRINQRCKQIEHEVARIDFKQRAQQHLDRVFNKWAAGHYRYFSLAGRCYAAAEELHWGDLGDFCRAHPVEAEQWQHDVINRAIIQLNRDAAISSPGGRLDTLKWLNSNSPNNNLTEASQALSYMGDTYSPDESPFAYTASQAPIELPLYLPLRCNAERLSAAMVSEVFGDQ